MELLLYALYRPAAHQTVNHERAWIAGRRLVKECCAYCSLSERCEIKEGILGVAEGKKRSFCHPRLDVMEPKESGFGLEKELVCREYEPQN